MQTTTTIEFKNVIDQQDLAILAEELLTEEQVILKVEGKATAITLIKNFETPIFYETDIKTVLVEKVNTFLEGAADLIASIFN